MKIEVRSSQLKNLAKSNVLCRSLNPSTIVTQSNAFK